jgi:hypothetical protein
MILYSQDIPRLASHMRIGELLRRCASANVIATILSKGDAMAGSIYFVQHKNKDENDWYATASDGHLLRIGHDTLSDFDVSQKVERLCHNDPDAWVVEMICSDNEQFHRLLNPS